MTGRAGAAAAEMWTRTGPTTAGDYHRWCCKSNRLTCVSFWSLKGETGGVTASRRFGCYCWAGPAGSSVSGLRPLVLRKVHFIMMWLCKVNQFIAALVNVDYWSDSDNSAPGHHQAWELRFWLAYTPLLEPLEPHFICRHKTYPNQQKLTISLKLLCSRAYK